MGLRIGLFGGSFNPAHTDHLRICTYIRQRLSLDRFIVIPNARPPHKETPVVDFRHRMMILRLLGFDEGGFEISDFEQNSAVAHYTINTVRAFEERFINDELFFCMGMDSLIYLDEWREGLSISDHCNLAVIGRAGYDIRSCHDRVKAYLKKHAVYEDRLDDGIKAKGCCIILNESLHDISSSKIRSQFHDFYQDFKDNPTTWNFYSREDSYLYCKKYLNQDVIDYILRNSLYT